MTERTDRELTATAGPWRARQCYRQTDDPGTTICHFSGWGVFSDVDHHGDPEADARLIAAAPAMLDALKTALRVIRDPESPITDTLWASGHETLVDAIAYAAAMAEGGEHG